MDRKRKLWVFKLLKTRLGCLERLAVKGQRSRERRERKETRLHSQSREGGLLTNDLRQRDR